VEGEGRDNPEKHNRTHSLADGEEINGRIFDV
jgi:hypothetical protein